jgi:hypothetical protein
VLLTFAVSAYSAYGLLGVFFAVMSGTYTALCSASQLTATSAHYG